VDRARDVPTLTVLGSGTLVPDDEHHSAAHLVRADGAYILLDCGAGTVHGFARHGVAWRELTHVAVSHYHTDHVGDLPALLLALEYGTSPKRAVPLTLVGPPGFAGFLEALGALPGSHVADPGFPLHVVELPPGRTYDHPEAGIRLSATPTPHTDESVAYRLDGQGFALGYTGDTGPSETVATFLARCDVLVAECTQADPPELDTHLSPERLADLAAVARPRVLVVTHVAPPATPESAGQAVSARWPGRVLPGRDGLVVSLRRR
jgi:ribonuclease BN (tRNA processing enzyme)